MTLDINLNGDISGDIEGIGATTDEAASVSVDEDASARSMVALMKGQKNLLIDLMAGITALDTLLGNISGDIEGIGATTDEAASVSVDEDTSARSMVALMKGQKNLLIDLVAGITALDTLTLSGDIEGIGATTDEAASVSVDEDASARSMVALMKGQKNLLIDLVAGITALDTLIRTTGINYLPISSAIDSIDVAKKSKGAVITAHSAITGTATSAEIDCRGFNSILVEAVISVATKNWTFKIQGCMVSGGTFVDMYEMANTGTMTLMSYQTNASKGFVFHGIPDYVRIVATEDEDGSTVTLKVQPFNA